MGVSGGSCVAFRYFFGRRQDFCVAFGYFFGRRQDFCVAFGYFFGRRHIILRQICPEVDRKWTGSGQLLPQSGQLLDNFWTTFGHLFNVNCEITNVKSENLVFHVKCEIILGQKLSTFCPFWSKSCPLAVQSCPFRGKSCPPKSANPLNYIKSVKKRPFSH